MTSLNCYLDVGEVGGEAGEEESLSSVLLPCTKVMERRDSGNYVFVGAASLQHRPCSETVHVCIHPVLHWSRYILDLKLCAWHRD